MPAQESSSIKCSKCGREVNHVRKGDGLCYKCASSSQQSKVQWTEEIIEYSSYCGPKVLATVLGISAEEAADKLIEVGETNFRGGWTSIMNIAEVMSKSMGIQLNVQSCARASFNGRGRNSHVRFTDRFPTLSQWLEDNKDKIAVLRAGHHFVFAAFGVVIESSGWEPKKARVTHMILVNP